MGTILNWYWSGGPFMVPLLVVGAAGLALLLERFSYIVLRSRIRARPFIEHVMSLARSGRTDEALELCAQHRSSLPDLGLVILRSHSDDGAALQDVADAAIRGMVPALTRRLAWLPTLAITALLLGALGGVLNLHDHLMSLPLTAGAEQARSLGLAFALRPLGIGILTAIPLVIGHTYLREEARNNVAQLEEFSTRLVNALTDRPDVRLGHR
ncbi:MAG TPA: MotA/TolQ/ExbB proton channel family protein [Gemmatimonadaceae bacterium]|nr:MotA/TolQ/ExbB proton channel family protein [Gemmatimonadaceae bacterium]